jgi:hypothetical protein
VELVLFPRVWEKYNKWITPDNVLVVEGKADLMGGDPKVLVDSLEELDLEAALSVPDLPAIDSSAYLPPAVLAVYGENGYIPPADSDSDLDDDTEEASLVLPPLNSETPRAFVETKLDDNGLSRVIEPAISPVEKRNHVEPPAALTFDHGPDDWHLFEPPIEEDWFSLNEFVQPVSNEPTLRRPETVSSLDGQMQARIQAPQENEIEVLTQTIEVENTENLHDARGNDLITEQPEQEYQHSETGHPGSIAEEKDRSFWLTSNLPIGDFQPPPFLSMPFLVSPVPLADHQNSETPIRRMLTVILRSTGDKQRDVRRLKRIHGILLSCPGTDKFSFLVFENGRRFLMDFPNDTTGITADLLRKLIEMVGEGNVSVEPIQIQ